jgi:hypothetical protein
MTRGFAIISVAAFGMMFLYSTTAHADAKSDVSITMKRSPDNTTNHAYLKNSGAKTVSATIVTTNYVDNKQSGQTTKVVSVAAGQEVFLGGTEFTPGRQTSSYAISAASY